MVPVLPNGSHSALPQVFLSKLFCLTSRMVRRQSSIPRRLCQVLSCRSRCDSTGDIGKEHKTHKRNAAITRILRLYPKMYETSQENSTHLVLSLVNVREFPECLSRLAGQPAHYIAFPRTISVS